jgi:hypothetical protein
MWTTVYNRNGIAIKDGWQLFQHELRREHQPIVKVDILNPALNPIGDFILSAGVDDVKGEITNLISDGNIDIDVERGTRRTAELTILNPSAEFTPATEDFNPEGPWVGLLYLNRIVRIWRGIKAGSTEMFTPVGTLMIDTSEVIVESNMCMVNLTMSDFWKKLTKSYMGSNDKYEEGTGYNAIINDFLNASGVAINGKYGAVLDHMPERSPDDKRIGNTLKLTRGESRGDKLKELAKHWGLDVYFDPMGVFRSEDRRREKDKQRVWTFSSSEIDQEGRNGGLVSLTRSFNDDNLYNHVIIIGTGNEKNTVKATKVDDRPNSKTNVDRIGNRVYLLESDKISTQAQADRALQRAWEKRFQLSETLTCETICNPCLEGDDAIGIEERHFAKVDGKYRLRRFNVPLVTSRQTVEVANIVRGDDL